MVKALHRAGIEVILDVVFNHTAEGDHRGPTLSFRGLDNTTYYMLEADRSRYVNYSGTGKHAQCQPPHRPTNGIGQSPLLGRDDGTWMASGSISPRSSIGTSRANAMPNPPVLWDIESDPVLAGTKLIAEAWDAAGLYQVGSFVGDSWKEWNGRFRDDVRSFLPWVTTARSIASPIA